MVLVVDFFVSVLEDDFVLVSFFGTSCLSSSSGEANLVDFFVVLFFVVVFFLEVTAVRQSAK